MVDVIATLWADVITLFCLNLNFGRCYANMTMDCHYVVLMGLMYLPLVADGMATGVWYGRCYYHLADVMVDRMEWLVDVIANVADE